MSARIAGAAAMMISSVLVTTGATPELPSSHPVHGLVAAERAFAAMSIERGMRDAFLAWLADESVLFRPFAVDGKQMWNERPPSAATLAWEPSYAEIAGAGDLGVTTGPWEFRPPPDSLGNAPTPDQYGYGQFLSVWRKQADGEWRLVVDIGVSHERSAPRAVGSGALTLGPDHVWAKQLRAGAQRADIAAIERLWAAAARKNPRTVFTSWGTDDLRLLREGEAPHLGRAAAERALASSADLLAIVPAGAGVSATDDLGYSYGVIERRAARGTAPDSSAYVHVWRKGPDRKWRIALAVENAVRRGQ